MQCLSVTSPSWIDRDDLFLLSKIATHINPMKTTPSLMQQQYHFVLIMFGTHTILVEEEQGDFFFNPKCLIAISSPFFPITGVTTVIRHLGQAETISSGPGRNSSMGKHR